MTKMTEFKTHDVIQANACLASSFRYWCAVAMCLIGLPASVAAQSGLNNTKSAGLIPERLEWISGAIQKSVDNNEIPGAVAILIKDGKVGYHRAFGYADLKSKTPMTTESIFRIASMSKLVTTVAALQLFERGHYQFNTPIDKFLPEFSEQKIMTGWDEEKNIFITKPAEKKILLRHLFTHTSGIVYPIFSNYGRDGYLSAGITDAFPNGTITLGENIQRLAGVPLAHEPGESYTYGMNMDVLGRLVEVVDGRPFAKYMREEIFEPLRMKDTGFSVPQDKWDRIVSVYTTMDNKLVPYDQEVADEKAPNNYVEWWKGDSDKIAMGGAGLLSTTHDYARFLQMLVNNGKFGGHRILGRKTVEMFQRGFYQSDKESTTSVGLSVGVVTDASRHMHPQSQGAFNGGGYFYTSFWVDPKEKFVGVFMSQLNPAQTNIGQQFKSIAYSALH